MSQRTLRHTVLWAPLLALAVAGSAACELAFTNLKAEAREEWSKTYELKADGRVEIGNTNGTISVEPSDDGKLHVRAERIAKAATEEAAKEALKRVEIVESVGSDRVRLETRTPSGGLFSGHASVNYAVRVPAGAAVKVENTNGHVSLRGLKGRVEAETTNGGIEGRGLAGGVEAATTNGGIEMELDAVAAEGVRAQTTNGGVRLRLPENAKADISASTVNGGIDTGSLKVETTGESSRRRLEGRLNGGGPRLALETTNGGITLSGTAPR